MPLLAFAARHAVYALETSRNVRNFPKSSSVFLTVNCCEISAGEKLIQQTDAARRPICWFRKKLNQKNLLLLRIDRRNLEDGLLVSSVGPTRLQNSSDFEALNLSFDRL